MAYCLICNKRYKAPDDPNSKKPIEQLFCTYHMTLDEDAKAWVLKQLTHNCPDCRAKGKIEISENIGGEQMIRVSMCTTCDGTGWVKNVG